MRPCPKCNGAKTRPHCLDVSKSVDCYNCNGAGEFPPLDYETIQYLAINPKTGKLWSTSLHTKAGRKRAQEKLMGRMPRRDVDRMARRAQYVWRMAQWHAGIGGSNLGGAIMADMDLGADPYKPELDGLADMVADKCYGKGANLVSAKRWHRAFHGQG